MSNLTLDQLILGEVNPFDPVTIKTGNFWTSNHQKTITTVDSIHKPAIEEIAKMVKRVAQDHDTRGILLKGDSGCGKSYLLARIKKNLNEKAFFAYIEPCPDENFLWRHTLRYTVESLMYPPEGKTESQMLLWLKNLPALKQRGLLKKILGEKTLFVNELLKKYPRQIYQARDFFAVLYELTKSEKHYDAYAWLRGDDLDENVLNYLGVKTRIDNENSAKNILSNFGRIADSTFPIVLCFDQVELAPKLPDGTLDISPVFNLNTALHNAGLKNFLVIISIIRNIYEENKRTIPQSDLFRFEKIIDLKSITKEQIRALWETRLYPLHSRATPKPSSSIEPLSTADLDAKYVGGRGNLRDSLIFGGKLYQKYKEKIKGESDRVIPLEASFKLLWQDELGKNQPKITKVSQFSSIELIDMLKKTLTALKVVIVKQKLLPSPTYASYSFSYKCPKSDHLVGILWDESPNMKSIRFAMEACQKALDAKLCDSLVLVRQEDFANKKARAYSHYQKIFHTQPNKHIRVDTESLHYLRTYQLLVNDAQSGDLVLCHQVITRDKLEELVRNTKVFEDCRLLQELKLFNKKNTKPDPARKLDELRDWCINFIHINKFIARKTLKDNCHQQFPEVATTIIEQVIDELHTGYNGNKPFVTILNPNVLKDSQIICLNP